MDVIFDLLGDPVVEPREGAGRPVHEVTDKKRNEIMLMLALGWPVKRMAGAMGIDVKTMRKHYSLELRARAVARDRLKAGHMAGVFAEAQGGNVAALKELGRIIERIEMTAGEMPATRARTAKPKPLGKKAALDQAAREGSASGEWGSLLKH